MAGNAELMGVVISSSVFGAIAGWVANRVAKALDAKVDARHAADLERLRSEAAKELQRIQALEDKLEARLAAATSLESAAHVATLPRRVEVAEKLWRIAIGIADGVMTRTGFLDVVTEAEYPSARERLEGKFPKAQNLDEALGHVASLGAERVDELRPFVSEELWQRFSAHCSFFRRVFLVAVMPDSRLLPWYKDSLAVGILEAAFPDKPRGGVATLYGARAALDQSLLAEVRRLMDGELASSRALVRSRDIEAAVEGRRRRTSSGVEGVALPLFTLVTRARRATALARLGDAPLEKGPSTPRAVGGDSRWSSTALWQSPRVQIWAGIAAVLGGVAVLHDRARRGAVKSPLGWPTSNNEVATDAVTQYEMAKRQGDPIQVCAQAGLVSAAYLQAKNEASYTRWKATERADCQQAGVPH